jgi:polyphenol oxidase
MLKKRYISPTIFTRFPQLVALESTRHGGISPAPFNTLNLGNFTDDTTENINENRRLLLKELGFELDQLCFSKQTHEDNIYIASEATMVEGYDAIITSQKGIIIGVTVADCTPILIYDAANEVVAAIHAGWKGTVLGIVAKTIETMKTNFNTSPTHCFAYIGTCIDVCDFEVGEEVATQFDASFRVWKAEKNKYHVDLKKANEQWLKSAGVPPEQIELSPHSTASQTTDYFSHRAERGQTGRMMALIGLLSLLFFMLLPIVVLAQPTHQLLQQGDAAYKNKDYTSAEQFYRQVEANGKSSGRATYNLGNTLYQQQRYDEAIASYQKASTQLWNPKDEALTFYNLGNAYYEKQNYPKSIEAYKNALRRNPNDLAAKKNLTLAMRHLQQQKKQQQPPNQPQPNQPNESSEQQEKDEQNRLLQVAQEEEQKTQRKHKKKSSSKKIMDKDW